jgi:hypothetical protein
VGGRLTIFCFDNMIVANVTFVEQLFSLIILQIYPFNYDRILET